MPGPVAHHDRPLAAIIPIHPAAPTRWSVPGLLQRVSLVFSLPSPLPSPSSPPFRLCGATTMAEGAEVAVTVRTSPVDRRFPTTNQTKHCWARYLEFHACAAAKDADDPECAKFKRWYRSLCPEEWVRSVFCFLLCSLLTPVFVGRRMRGGRHVYEPLPGCFMGVSRHGGVLLSCTCVGCCAFVSARDAELGLLTYPPINGVLCLCFSRPSLMSSCAASVGVRVCRLLRWRSGIRCARKGASRAQSNCQACGERGWMAAVSCGTVGRQVGVGGGASVFPFSFLLGLLSSTRPWQTTPPPASPGGQR